MSTIVSDVQNIIVLAKKVLGDLLSKRIRRARRELRKIINLDLDEITRLKNNRIKKLTEECSIVFKDAKRALWLIERTEETREAMNLVEEIIALEERQLVELSQEEKRENALYLYWKNVIRAKKLYTGTSSLSIPQIERYGLVPTMRPPFWDDFKRLHQLYEKAGVYNPLRLGHGAFKTAMGMVNKGIFVTPSYTHAKRYALKSPAIWHEFVGNLDLDAARRKFLLEAFFQGQLFGDWEKECQRVYDRDPKSFYENLTKHFTTKGYEQDRICALSKSEVYEIKRIFERLWLMFRETKAVVLHLSVLAPPIAEEEPFKDTKTRKSAIYDFPTFLRFFDLFAQGKPIDEAKGIFESHVFTGYQIVVQRRIPRKFIEIEYV